jgi:ribosome-associated heat shock protein Hsp15
MEQSERIDKWLWTVRIFKTRNQATLACKAGKVQIDGIAVKPSRELKQGDIITIRQMPVIKTVKMLAFPPNRLAAKLVPDFMEDLTPASEYEKLKIMRETNFELRERGVGRPTKKQRRDIELLKQIWKE